jgi:hypothetical protein
MNRKSTFIIACSLVVIAVVAGMVALTTSSARKLPPASVAPHAQAARSSYPPGKEGGAAARSAKLSTGDLKELVATYGESRAALSKTVNFQCVSALDAYLTAASGKTVTNSEALSHLGDLGLPENRFDEPVDLKLTEEQKAAFVKIYAAYRDQTIEGVKAELSAMKDHPGQHMEALLAADATANGSVSPEDYAEIKGSRLVPTPETDSMFNLSTRHTIFDDAASTDAIAGMLDPDQAEAFRTANAGRIAAVQARLGNAGKPPKTLEQVGKAAEGLSKLLEMTSMGPR